MLVLENISFEAKTDDGNKEIINNISLTIPDKSFTVITGPNGGGKSTLAKLIMGIEHPTSGRILLDGVDITGMSITDRAKSGVGFAFQQPIRFKGLTVYDLICFAAGKHLDIKDSCHYLSEVGLCAQDYINRELNASLSGGEMKRIEIALLLARSPKLSIFDEPEAGIDLWSFSRLIDVFKKMRDTTQGAVIIISHQERILSIANQLIVIANGRIEKIGTSMDDLEGIYGNAPCCDYFKRNEVN